MKNTSQSAYVSIAKALKRIEHQGDIRALRAFLASEALLRDLMALEPALRHQAYGAGIDLLARMQAKIGPLLRETPTKAFKWNDMMVARLRKAEAKYGTDEDVARALGLTIKAAARARLRFIGPRAQIAAATAEQRVAA